MTYAVAIGTGNVTNGRVGFTPAVGYAQFPMGTAEFQKTLAKGPTVTTYSDVTAVVNAVRDQNSGADRGVSAVISSTKRISQLSLASAATAGGVVTFHYTADTGW